MSFYWLSTSLSAAVHPSLHILRVKVIYMNIYIHICMYICIYTHPLRQSYIYRYIYICICVYIHIYMYIYTHIYIYMHVYIYVYIYICSIYIYLWRKGYYFMYLTYFSRRGGASEPAHPVRQSFFAPRGRNRSHVNRSLCGLARPCTVGVGS